MESEGRPCSGLGECLRQCTCECADCTRCGLSISGACQCTCDCDGDDCPHMPEIVWRGCTCGHRAHHGYCPPDVQCLYRCEPKPCHNDANHDESGELFPEWLFACHGGSCVSCAIAYGHGFKHTEKQAECPVCYNQKMMSKLRCAHEICWDCWSTICRDDSATCPLCRRSKW